MDFITILSKPFEWLSNLLRDMSLSSGGGNVAAIVIYSIFCSIPLIAMLIIILKKRFKPEDLLLPVLSILLFVIVYILINPNVLNYEILVSGQVNKCLSLAVYSVFVGYFILVWIRNIYKAEGNKIYSCIKLFLVVMLVIAVYQIFVGGVIGMVNGITYLKEANLEVKNELLITYIFIVAQYLVDIIPFVMCVIIVIAVLKLMKEMTKNSYSDMTLTAAKKLSKLCAISTVIIVISEILFNISQIFLLDKIKVVNISIEFPIISLIFMLAIMVFTKYISEGKNMKEDNDLFI